MPDTQPSKRVLVVDDETAIADTLALILRTRGYHAECVYSAEAAVLCCRDMQPHVVISDVVMGQMNGFALAAHIAAHHPGCKVILVSGQPQTSTLLRDSEVAGHSFQVLAKPVHPQVILDLVAA